MDRPAWGPAPAVEAGCGGHGRGKAGVVAEPSAAGPAHAIPMDLRSIFGTACWTAEFLER